MTSENAPRFSASCSSLPGTRRLAYRMGTAKRWEIFTPKPQYLAFEAGVQTDFSQKSGRSASAGAATNAIAAINIVAELDDAIRSRPGRHIDPVERHRLRQPRILAITGTDHVIDLLTRPARRIVQEPSHQFTHILHAHAAGRVEAEILAEQILRRRVAHIDAVR